MELIVAALELLTRLLPILRFFDGSDLSEAMVRLLNEIIPVAIKEANDLDAPIKAIIAALSAHPATTKVQLATLRALEAKVDAAFDAAAKADRIA